MRFLYNAFMIVFFIGGSVYLSEVHKWNDAVIFVGFICAIMFAATKDEK